MMMFKAEKELISSSKSHCKVGKITPKKNGVGDSCAVQIDFKTEDFKKSNIQFTKRARTL
jgi:hypothetical protein